MAQQQVNAVDSLLRGFAAGASAAAENKRLSLMAAEGERAAWKDIAALQQDEEQFRLGFERDSMQHDEQMTRLENQSELQGKQYELSLKNADLDRVKAGSAIALDSFKLDQARRIESDTEGFAKGLSTLDMNDPTSAAGGVANLWARYPGAMQNEAVNSVYGLLPKGVIEEALNIRSTQRQREYDRERLAELNRSGSQVEIRSGPKGTTYTSKPDKENNTVLVKTFGPDGEEISERMTKDDARARGFLGEQPEASKESVTGTGMTPAQEKVLGSSKIPVMRPKGSKPSATQSTLAEITPP